METDSKLNNNLLRKNDIQIKIICALSIFIFIFILIALISYSPSDEQNVQISFIDIFKVFSGDEDILAKASMTKNWLGLAGAKIADIFYNKTFGYYTITVPLIAILWLVIIFFYKKISKELIKYTIIYIILGILFSGLIGSLQTLDFLSSIPKSWSGAVGQYIAHIISSIIGSLGAIFVLASLIVLVIYLSSDIKLLFNDSIKSKFSDYLKGFLNNTKTKKDIAVENAPNTTNNSNEIVEEISEDIQVVEHVEPVDTTSIHKDNIESIPVLKTPKINIRKIDDNNTIVSSCSNPFEEKKIAPEINTKDNLSNISIKEDISTIIPNDIIDKISHSEIPKSIKIDIEKPTLEDTAKDKINEPNKDIGVINPKEQAEITKDINKNSIDEKITNNEINENIETTRLNITIDSNPQKIQEETEETERNILSNSQKKFKTKDDDEELSIHNHIHKIKINYKNPVIDLLNNQSSESNVNELELQTNAQILQEKLETFKIYIQDLTVTPGPVVTQYEFVPAAGIKISKIESLADDLAMALKAKGIRIIAPIPGKGTVGVEIPNNKPSIVRFGEIVNSQKFGSSTAILPLALGKTISGEVYIADLTKMPHLLMAGSTGSGKSVGINTIISSLLYKKHPSELKFVIIDPKKVELQQYSSLAYHYMATSPDIEDIIVTKPEDAVIVLKAAVKEMETRYDILASVSQRNISDFNSKAAKGLLKDSEGNNIMQMPYIVVIIDELADLMLTASKEIEEPITRLAQMARAVGIHLVIATQRPSVDVITGVIKANFPARIAFLVASKIDSRTILDMQGAEQLLGQGDMLFLPPGQPKPIRIQNAFISTEEVDQICEFVENQKGYNEPYYLPTLIEKNSNNYIDPSDRDPLFEEAARLIIRTQQGSVSMLQRRLKIGYARAGRIVDELESAGVVGPFDGSKARIVLMESESELERIL